MVYKPTFTSLGGPILYGIYPLVNVYITNWNITMLFSWVNPLFRLGHGFNSKPFVYQRLNGNLMGFHYEFPWIFSYSHEITMNFHRKIPYSWEFMVISWTSSGSNGISMGFQWDFHGNFPWEYQEASKTILTEQYDHGISWLWGFRGNITGYRTNDHWRF